MGEHRGLLAFFRKIPEAPGNLAPHAEGLVNIPGEASPREKIEGVGRGDAPPLCLFPDMRLFHRRKARRGGNDHGRNPVGERSGKREEHEAEKQAGKGPDPSHGRSLEGR
jgi:hypothetical protein